MPENAQSYKVLSTSMLKKKKRLRTKQTFLAIPRN